MGAALLKFRVPPFFGKHLERGEQIIDLLKPRKARGQLNAVSAGAPFFCERINPRLACDVERARQIAREQAKPV